MSRQEEDVEPSCYTRTVVVAAISQVAWLKECVCYLRRDKVESITGTGGKGSEAICVGGAPLEFKRIDSVKCEKYTVSRWLNEEDETYLSYTN